VHHLDDGVDVLLLFLLGVGVVEAQVADAAVVLRQAEVQADALGMADVQVAVGLGREAGADAGRVGGPGQVVGRVARAAAPVPLGRCRLQVALDDAAQEIACQAALNRAVATCSEGQALPAASTPCSRAKPGWPATAGFSGWGGTAVGIR
jgi:hypothetical protein